jgi:hypothetical protein
LNLILQLMLSQKLLKVSLVHGPRYPEFNENEAQKLHYPWTGQSLCLLLTEQLKNSVYRNFQMLWQTHAKYQIIKFAD